MAVGRKTGGRKKGTPNKSKRPTIMQLAKRMAEEQQLAGELQKQTPLEFLLSIMQDPTYQPGARIECAKACLPFCHAKKADEPSEKAVVINEIRRIIVRPPERHDRGFRTSSPTMASLA
jgi:hypothetical protein